MRVLLIERDPDDARLARQLLSSGSSGGLKADLECDWIDTPAGVFEALGRRRYDVVVLSLEPCDESALDTLAWLREAAPWVPVVALSRSGDDRMALEVLHRGAQDCLAKDELEGRSLIRALRYAVERNKAARMSAVERDFAAAVTVGAGNLVIVLDRKGRVLRFSRACELLTGFSEREVLGRHPWDTFLGPEDGGRLRDSVRRMTFGAAPQRDDLVWVTKTGETRVVTGCTVPLYEPDGSVGRIVWTGVDATARVAAEKELEAGRERLRTALTGMVYALSRIVETRDPYTAGHQKGVGRLAAAIGAEMGLEPEQVRGLNLAGIVHDIGKVSVPAEILVKPSALSEFEFGLVRRHPQVGYDILKDIDFPWPIAKIILQHHERLDGSGYPFGLKGKDIILEARILAVADTVEAMASHRPYRPAVGVAAALAEVARYAGTLYDPEAVRVCLRLFHEKGFSFTEEGAAAGGAEP